MILNENEYFNTSDLSLTAFLCCFGCKIEAVDRSKPRAIFVLKKEKGIDDLIQGFWSHSVQVDPLQYFNSLKEVKTRLYSS